MPRRDQKKDEPNVMVDCACGCKNQRWKYDKCGREMKYMLGHFRHSAEYLAYAGKLMSDASRGKPNWSAGTGVFKDYKERAAKNSGSHRFRKLKTDLKRMANWTCCKCGARHENNERKIHLNHIDHNPFNNDLSNLEVLCAVCHIGGHKKEQHQIFLERAS